MQRTVLLWGGYGNLGSDCADAFRRCGDVVIQLDRKDCDIALRSDVVRCLDTHRPTIAINAAAYNAVDAAEGDGRAVAEAVNALAPGILAEETKKRGISFVHISTDYVFAGDRGVYTETDHPDPVNVYGKTKLAGECAVSAAHDGAFIVRTSKLFGRQGASSDCKPSFVTMIAKLALTKPSLTLVDAEIGCPTYTKDLADAIVTLMNGTYVPGIYHLINEDEGVNWRAFAEEIFSTLGIAPVFTCVSGDAFPRLAKRADDVSMVNTKGPKLPSRRDALARFFRGPLKGGTTITLTGIPGLFTCTPHRFGDPRGWFSEVMNCDFLRSIGMDAPLVQINEGQSVKGIVRGLHFQRPPFAQTKLVSCTAGRLFDVAVDIRKGSSTYGKSFGVELSAENGMGLYISEGFAHGMMALEDGTRIRYHVFGSGYEPSAEGGLRWNDPSLQIAWPCIDMEPVANSRDANWTLFEETSSPF